MGFDTSTGDASTGESVVREEVAIPFENGLHARPEAIHRMKMVGIVPLVKDRIK